MGEYLIGTGVTINETFFVSGVATDPTTVTFYLRDPHHDLTTYVFGVDPEITNPSVGTYRVDLIPTIVGHYNYRVQGTGAVVAVCEGDFDILPSPTLNIVPTGAEFGPCTAWVDVNDVAACCNVEVGSDTSLFEEAAFQASQTLYELSGRKYAGSCERTVRPCGEQVCGFQVLSRGFIVWPNGQWFGDGWGWNGWGWNWPDFNGCGCQPLDRVLLSGYPVTAVTQVKIDGSTVDPNTYRLDEFRYLTRVREHADDDFIGWPACQMMDLPDTETGTFSVTYIGGVDPPALGRGAAAQLACEFYKSCAGMADCALPPGTTRATRQGITIDKLAVLTWGWQPLARGETKRGWSTGLPLVDAFLNTYNPSGLQRRPVVWSPDGAKYARPMG